MIRPGSRLGRFLILEKLGEGGMGAVYRAEDSADGSTVAIKVLHPDEARRPRARRRFAKEARLLAEVNNPYVTNLVEVNEDGGVHYLVLEFVAGTSLARWLVQRGRLDEPTALGIMADVARALDFAHGRGIVHRDVKPENILLVGPGLASSPTTASTAATLPDPRRREDSTGPEDSTPAGLETTVVLLSTDPGAEAFGRSGDHGGGRRPRSPGGVAGEALGFRAGPPRRGVGILEPDPGRGDRRDAAVHGAGTVLGERARSARPPTCTRWARPSSTCWRAGRRSWGRRASASSPCTRTSRRRRSGT